MPMHLQRMQLLSVLRLLPVGIPQQLLVKEQPLAERAPQLWDDQAPHLATFLLHSVPGQALVVIDRLPWAMEPSRQQTKP